MSDQLKEFEVTLPETLNPADWNTAIAEGAAKAGVEIPRDEQGRFVSPNATAAAAADKKEPEAEKVYESTLNVNGSEMVFRGKDAADVLTQYSAAVTAAQLAIAKPAAEIKKEEPKPAFTDAEMLDIQMGLVQGKTEALDKYIANSGVLDRYLESKGLSIDTLKAQTEKTKSNDINAEWTASAKDFMEQTPDFQATEQNNYVMGMMLGELGLTGKPSVDSYQKAYARMKERKLVYPGTAAPTNPITPTPEKKKEPTSGTAVGSAGTHETRQSAIDHSKKYEIDLTQIGLREAGESYNEMIRAGIKPENISYKQP